MAVHSLLGYALAVPDIEAGRTFYETFGLSSAAKGGMAALRCFGRGHDEVLLVEGPRKRLHHLRFAADQAGLAAIRERAQRAGIKEENSPLREDGDGTWLRDDDGHYVNIRLAPPPHAAVDKPLLPFNTPGHYGRVGAVGCPPAGVVRPRRLGHVLLFAPDVNRKIKFYSDILGFKLSDRSGEIIAFMHTAGGGDHHVLAFAKSDKPGFHHGSYEVGSVDEIGMGAQHVLQSGYRNGWGFGRHVIGSNFFHYVRDPWNSLAEYFCDIDRIPGDGSWQPKDYPLHESLYRWGPPVPEDFVRNFEE
jgi:catechol 2,3-dioxygenase-like lactoylglutathione lyase family enzyme